VFQKPQSSQQLFIKAVSLFKNMDFLGPFFAVNHPSFSSSPQDQPSPTSQVAGDDKAEILQHSIGSRPLTEQLR